MLHLLARQAGESDLDTGTHADEAEVLDARLKSILGLECGIFVLSVS